MPLRAGLLIRTMEFFGTTILLVNLSLLARSQVKFDDTIREGCLSVRLLFNDPKVEGLPYIASNITIPYDMNTAKSYSPYKRKEDRT